jgi:hypothetical protein
VFAHRFAQGKRPYAEVLKMTNLSAAHWISRMIVVITFGLLAGCGSSSNPMMPLGAKGLVVTPFQPVANSSMAPPQNQATFNASLEYTDGSVKPVSSGVQWSYDSAPWVTLVKNTATCTAAAPQVVTNVPSPSQITATASVDGVSYTASSALSCY